MLSPAETPKINMCRVVLPNVNLRLTYLKLLRYVSHNSEIRISQLRDTYLTTPRYVSHNSEIRISQLQDTYLTTPRYVSHNSEIRISQHIPYVCLFSADYGGVMKKGIIFAHEFAKIGCARHKASFLLSLALSLH